MIETETNQTKGCKMGEFLTVEEVAKMFRVTSRTIFRYIKCKKIVAQKIPGTKQWLINSDELKKIFDQKQQKATCSETGSSE